MEVFGKVIEETTEKTLADASDTLKKAAESPNLSPEEEEAISRKLEETVSESTEKADEAADTFLGKIKWKLWRILGA